MTVPTRCTCGRPAATTGEAAKAGKCQPCYQIKLYTDAVKSKGVAK